MKAKSIISKEYRLIKWYNEKLEIWYKNKEVSIVFYDVEQEHYNRIMKLPNDNEGISNYIEKEIKPYYISKESMQINCPLEEVLVHNWK